MNSLKWLLFALLAVFAFAVDKCDDKAQISCLDDIYVAYPACQKAAQEKGKDVPVDLICLQYFANLSQECWPCICWVAKLEKWTIKGC